MSGSGASRVVALAALLVLPAARVRAEEPVYLRGIDLTLPAQEAFRDWPPEALSLRPYWLPWSPVSFQRAAMFGRPVFFVLTVNWSASAEALDRGPLRDPEVLRLLNAGYVTIRANADVRPDVRERYQTGNWPVVALLLPDGLPMLNQVGHVEHPPPITIDTLDPAALRVMLEEGIVYWQEERDALLRAGAAWAADEGPAPPRPGEVSDAASDTLARWLRGSADRTQGGFGSGARFVIPWMHEYAELVRARGGEDLTGQTLLTLGRLLDGPLSDRQGGGVRRLAGPSGEDVQDEKMLDGNAALVRELCLALRGADQPQLREGLVATTRFIRGVLGRPQGGFFQAQLARDVAAGAAAAPGVDPLVVAGPNALAAAALLRAGGLLEDPALAQAGRAALDFVLREGYARGRGVGHVLAPANDGRLYLTAQADVALAAADAYESTGDPAYLAAAADLAEFSLRNLKQPEEPLARDAFSEAGTVGLLARPRHPLRPNVRLARVLTRLALHGRGTSHRDAARGILAACAGDLTGFGVHGIEAAVAFEEWLHEPLLIRLAPAGGDAARDAAWRAAALRVSWPWTVVTTAPSGRPGGGAELVWGGKRRTVSRPEDLAAAARKLARVPS